MPKKRQGLILVHTGEGKGKSTSAFGTALRAACGYGWKVAVLQFIKGKWKPGEYKIPRFVPNFEITPMGRGFTWESDNLELDKASAQEAWEACKAKVFSGEYDLLVFDELTYCFHFKFLPLEPVLEVLRNKPPELHIIITGRDAPQELIEIADLVTEMRLIKHPYERGIKAQKGIEF